MSIKLLSIDETHQEFLEAWSTHAEITRNTLGRRFPAQRNAIQAWILASNVGEYPQRIAYVVSDSGPVGLVQLDQIDWVSGNGWLGIWLIPSSRGAGRGSLVVREICRRAIDDFGLRQLRLLVRTDNVSAIKVYKNLGFQTEGELVQAEFRDGNFLNLFVMRLDLRSAS